MPSCGRRSASCASRVPGCSRSSLPSAAGWSATCTTARSSASSRWRSTCASRSPRCSTDPEQAQRLLEGAGEELEQALAELRELARGIHPAVLTDRGIDPAVETLANRAPMPVEVVEKLGERVPKPVELAAYFVVSEALTNVAKYAHASRALIRVGRENGRLVVEVADDGIGGADPSRGTGLRGLEDRVLALGGRLDVTSPVGTGTRVIARIPCE